MLILALILGLVIFSGYPRLFLRRVNMYIKIKSLCKRKRFSVVGAKRIWLLGGRRNGNNDFYIETPRKVYSIKLFGCRKKNASLIFDNEGGYIIRNYLAFVGNTGARAVMSMESKRKSFPRYNFYKNFQNNW